jgi:polar amino acid transport system substrate-binding protein
MNKLIILIPVILILTGCAIKADSVSIQGTPNTVKTSEPESDRIIRITNGEWVPYTGKNLPGYGCDSRIVSAVFSRLGYTVEYGFFPWARGFHLAETGEWDGMIEWADTVEARSSFYVSKSPVSKQEFVFFHRKDRPIEWETTKDLAGKVIGLTSGYLYSDLFNSLRNDSRYQFQEASTDEANFEKLLAGRIDIFPMERNVGLVLLKTKFTPDTVDQLTYDDKPLSSFDPYFFLTKKDQKNENRMKQFNLAFEEFKVTGDFQKITEDCNQ